MLPIVLIRKRKTEIKVTPWYVVPRPQANAHEAVLVYTRINPINRHIFLSFLAIVTSLLYCQPQ